jgi:predicted NBD/HSP70 family sugar kinase
MGDRRAAMNTTSRSEHELVQCFRGRTQLTRAEILDLTGLSRVTVSQGIQELISRKILIESGGDASHGGRKASYLSLNESSGYVGVVYFSATSVSIAIANLKGEIQNSQISKIAIEEGPNKILPESISQIKEMFKTIPKNKRLGIVVGVPGPVSHTLGKVVSPPIMRGWDGVNFQKEFSEALSLPTYLENDANLLAIAEHRLVYPEIENMLLVKVATGIGSGMILSGKLHRGHGGSAGDIGHMQLDALKGLPCRCGHTDCVESFASGWALTEKLIDMGYKVKDTSDIAELCRKGDTKVLRLVIEASSYIGHAVADAVNLLNPSKVIIVGRLVEASDLVLATIKEVVYQRSGALATKNLEILGSELGDDMALLGSAQLGLDQFFYSTELS